MKCLLHYGTEYAKKSDWKDFALVKFCLCAMGIMIGCAVPKKHRKPVVIASALVFLATYVPLMAKFVRIIIDAWAEEHADVETE